MEIKVCVNCKKELPLNEFYLKPNGKYHSWCNSCRKEKKHQWDIEHTEHRRKYRKDNHDHIKEVNDIYLDAHREQINEKARNDYPKNKERIAAHARLPKSRERQRKYRQSHKKEINKGIKRYYENNPLAKLARDLRSRTNRVLNGNRKDKGLWSYLGCDEATLRIHIESKFTEGMTWENHSFHGWHIDHIIPCNAFDFNLDLHKRACFHYTNLQPMWGKLNISKHANYLQEDFDNYIKLFIN